MNLRFLGNDLETAVVVMLAMLIANKRCKR